MLDYHWHKHNLDKMFNMDCRRGAPYPHYNMDKVNSMNVDAGSDNSKQFKQHNFDIYQKKQRTNPNSIQPLVELMQHKEENKQFVVTITNMMQVN